MHELSLAQAIVETAGASARAAGARQVRVVHVRVGALAGVEPGALAFCYDAASAGTALEGSTLRITRVPLKLWCATCAAEVVLPDVGSLRCPRCGQLSADVREGRELEIEALEIEVD